MSLNPEDISLPERNSFEDLFVLVDDELRDLFPILEEELFYDFVHNFRSWCIAFEGASNFWRLFKKDLAPVKSRLIAITDNAESASTFAGSDVVRAVVSGDGQVYTGVEQGDDSNVTSLIQSVLCLAPNAAFMNATLTTQGREIIIEKGGALVRLTSDELKLFIAIWHRWIGNGDDIELAVYEWIERYVMEADG